MADNDNTGDGRRARIRPDRYREIETPTEVEQRYALKSQDPVEETATEEEKPPPRWTDLSPRQAKRSERVVVGLFLLAGAAGIGFMVAYVASDLQTIWDLKWSNRWLGLTMAVSFLAMGAGITHWVRRLMPQQELVQKRKPIPSSMEEKKEFVDYFMVGGESTGITKRPMLRRTLLAALVPFGVAPLFLIRGLGGNMPFERLRHTVWREGTRLTIHGTGEYIKPGDFAVPGSLQTVIPEGYEHKLDVLADATVQLIKTRPGELKPPTNLDWVVDGIVAYSKICTHAGCATGLYEDTTKYILCPCHQSTFDAAHGCRVIFGPAPYPLPQLPLAIDAEGYLVAAGDFPEPPGPPFWERGNAGDERGNS